MLMTTVGIRHVHQRLLLLHRPEELHPARSPTPCCRLWQRLPMIFTRVLGRPELPGHPDGLMGLARLYHPSSDSSPYFHRRLRTGGMNGFDHDG